jgi:Rieske Fe-S protein
MPDPVNRPRRRFVNWLLGTGAGSLVAAIVYPVSKYVSPPDIPEAQTSRVLAGKISEMAAGGWKIFKFGNDPGILVRTADGDLRAFSATCTHLSCTVQFRKDLGQIWCACHNGIYDLNGLNVSGPPPRPLTNFTVNVSGDDIYVAKG